MAQADKKPADDAVTQAPADAAGVEGAPREYESIKGASMAHDDKALRGGRTDGPILTAEPKREADKTSSPVPNDAELEDPPVRTARPDVPIVVSMASGAGQHTPPDPAKFHPDGRPRHPGNP